MFRRPDAQPKQRTYARRNRMIAARQRRPSASGKRARAGDAGRQGPFVPPEDWHDPGHLDSDEYRIIVQDPGPGVVHVVTPAEIEQRLLELPASLLSDLAVVQLSRLTRKKRTFPCYGLQWGHAIYLYPIEADLIERFSRPPHPAQVREARMFGGRWVPVGGGCWELHWTPETIRDFYLNNVLIHELGHLNDNRNTNYHDRERFADAFAIRYGYQPSRGEAGGPPSQRRREYARTRRVRRHHRT